MNHHYHYYIGSALIDQIEIGDHRIHHNHTMKEYEIELPL